MEHLSNDDAINHFHRNRLCGVSETTSEVFDIIQDLDTDDSISQLINKAVSLIAVSKKQHTNKNQLLEHVKSQFGNAFCNSHIYMKLLEEDESLLSNFLNKIDRFHDHLKLTIRHAGKIYDMQYEDNIKSPDMYQEYRNLYKKGINKMIQKIAIDSNPLASGSALVFDHRQVV